MKREYLRGLINGQTTKLSENYTLEELNIKYQEYLNDNVSYIKAWLFGKRIKDITGKVRSLNYKGIRYTYRRWKL